MKSKGLLDSALGGYAGCIHPQVPYLRDIYWWIQCCLLLSATLISDLRVIVIEANAILKASSEFDTSTHLPKPQTESFLM